MDANQQLLQVDARSQDAVSLRTVSSSQRHKESRWSSRSKVVHKSWTRIWWFEVLAMATSTAALLAIFGILFAYNGKPLTMWNAALRPNTIVAVLSTLSKSAMLMVVGQCIGQLKWVYFEQRPHRLVDIEVFDDASRGPLGSAKLLLQIHWTALLASVGAVITILSLAMDPFVQQVISYDTITFDDSTATAQIGTSHFYDTGLGVEIHTTFNGASSANPIGLGDANIAGSIYKGIYGNAYESPVECTSGDCTWPSYEALGICSSCFDLTTDHEANCTIGFFENSEGIVEASNRTGQVQTANGLPVDSFNYCRSSDDFGTLWNASVLTWRSEVDGKSVLTRNGTIAIIAAAEFDLIVDQDKPHCESEDFNNVRSVVECALTYCVKTYGDTTVRNGTLSNVPSKSDTLHFMEFDSCRDGFNNGSGFEITTWSHSDNYSDDSRRVNLPPAFRQTDTPNYSCPDKGNEDELWEATHQLAATFQQDERAFLINSGNTGDIQRALRYIFEGGLSELFEVGPDSIALALSAAQKQGRFHELMDDVAESMTNQIRAGPNSTRVEGKVHITEIRITVRWPWMALPGAIVLLSIALLASSITFSGQGQRTVWKSSLLASLFHGLQGWSEQQLNDLQPKGMEARAKQMWTRLEVGEGGHIGLVKQD